MKTLDPKIVKKLSEDLKIAPKTVRNNISRLAQSYPSASPNALAHIYALDNGKSVLSMLSSEDRKEFPSSPRTFSPSIQRQSVIKVIPLSKDENSILMNPLVQLISGFFLVGIIAGTIAQVLGIYFAKLLKLT